MVFYDVGAQVKPPGRAGVLCSQHSCSYALSCSRVVFYDLIKNVSRWLHLGSLFCLSCSCEVSLSFSQGLWTLFPSHLHYLGLGTAKLLSP